MAESTLIQDKQFHRSADLIVKKYWKFFIPMLLTAMSGELALVVDSVLVGRYLGPTAMSAVSMSSSVETLIYAFAVLFSLGAEGLISIAMGSRNRAVADKYYTVVLFLETFFGFLIAAVGCLFIDPIISLITDEPEIITFLKPYLFITMLGIFPYLPMTGWNVVIQADGLPHITTISIAACQVVNLVLDIVLMKYCNMGPTGAAIATQTGYIVGILIQVFMYLPNKKRTLHWTGSVFGEMRSMCKKAWEIIRSGIPTAFGLLLASLKTLIIFRIVQSLGGVESADVYSVAIPCITIATVVIGGTTESMMPIVGCLFGEKDFHGVRMITKYVMRFCVILTAVIALLLILFPHAVFHLFSMPDSVVEHGRFAFQLFAVSLIGMAICNVLMYHYVTIQQRKAALLLNTLEGFLLVVPVAWLLSKVWGLNGVFASFIVAEFGTVLVMWIYSKVAKDERGHFNNIYLVDDNSNDYICDISLKASPEAAVKVSRAASQAMKDAGYREETCSGVALALEESIVNICNYPVNEKTPVNVDIRISKAVEGNTEVLIRDDGKAFDPLTYNPEHDENFLTDGIQVLKAVAKDIKYDRHISLNQSVITI